MPGPDRHPAPGSSVPGAPPALRRPLNEHDGLLVAPAAQHPAAAQTPTASAPPAPRSAPTPEAQGSAPYPYLLAVGLLSAAIAIEVATRRWRRTTLAFRPNTTIQERS